MKKIISRIIKRLQLAKLIIPITPHYYVKCDKESVLSARSYLESFQSNPDTSCITHNNIEQMVDLHIIVPAYNEEKFICDCIDSIVLPPKSITYCLTIIDDGSTDGTGDLLRNYSNIKQLEVITQENKGFSGARNRGLENIRGRYVAFVDSDDKVQWDELENMVKLADKHDADMVEGGMYITTEEGKVISKISSSEKHFKGFACGKVFASDILRNICFPEKYWYEDTLVEQILFELMEKKFSYSNLVYYYRQNKKGITVQSLLEKKSIDSLWILLSLHKDREILDIPVSQYYYEFVLRHIHLTYNRIFFQEEEVKMNVFIVLSDFVNKEFPEYHTVNKQMVNFEKYVRSADYGKWSAFCKWTEIK